MTKTRRRLNSITTTGNLLARPEEQPGSIGFPSVIPVPQPQDLPEDRYPPRTPRRTFTPDSVSTFTSGGIRSPTYLDTDSAKILHLMKTTCGRMHGILFFRQLRTNIWASGYCSVQVATGSLVCQVKGETAQTKTLISDLRGCSVRTHYDSETQSTYLSIQIASNGAGFQLRPSVPETFDSWLAALLCWQPLRPRGIHNKMAKPQPVAITDKRPSAQRRMSELGAQKSKAAIKVGKLLLWDGPLPSGSQASAYQQVSKLNAATDTLSLWRRVSCNLHENGSFKLFSEGDNQPLSSIALSQLARCAVQRFDQSILDMPYCVAIYPQYTIQASAMRQKRPMVLCFENRVAFEAWFVLLRALTVPEWYGPEQPRPGSSRQEQDPTQTKSREMKDMFRIERQLTLKIIEGKFVHSFGDKEVHEASRSKRKSTRPHGGSADVYADVICGQDLRARTTIKSSGSSVFWADEFTLMDLPSSLNRVAVVVRAGNPGEQEWTMIAHGPYDMSAGEAGLLSGLGGIEISSHDSVIGKIEVQIDELEREGNIEKWMPIVDSTDRVAGQILMKLALQESVVLMSEDYTELSTLLHNWSNSLTSQMAHALGPDLKLLSDVLLDYYQSTGDARDWLCNLIEEEIDGIYRETPPMRMRFSGRLQSNDSYESAEQREQLVRDLSRSATMEANLLFRGNSLITRALDAHMRRLGRDYLEATLGARLRKICDRDFDCEVDPGKVKSPEHLDRNWNSLIQLTSSIWKAIIASAEDCPAQLRVLFRHIRSCAEDRYGSFIRTVKYTSVSGFLFLRFFCPAILNPKLFGLLSGKVTVSHILV
jgi:GTPase-activator protein for Ras-like GTPase